MGQSVKVLAGVIGVLSALDMTTPARADISVTGFVGVLTDNVWEEVVTPWRIEPVESGVAAVALRWDRALGAAPFRLGVETQVTVHAGVQDHVEVSVPVVAEYRPEGAWAGPLRGLGFGLGLSWASDAPELEIERGGETQAVLFYWMAEGSFASPWADTEVVLRLHHRSDGFGLLPVDTGSNVVMLGLRRRF